MSELKHDREADLSFYGEDPYINIATEHKKYMTDLKIHTKTGFKHHFNAFHELGDTPLSALLTKSNKST